MMAATPMPPAVQIEISPRPRQDFRQRRDDASARRRGSTAERSGESV